MAWKGTGKSNFWVPGLHRGHALARGLVVAVPLTEPSPGGRWEAFDLAGRVQAIRGNRTRAAGRHGWGAGLPGEGPAAIEWAWREGLDAACFTAAVAVEYGATRSGQGRLMTRGAAEPWGILEEVVGEQGTAVGRVSFQESGSWQVGVATGSPPMGAAGLVVLRVRAPDRQLRLDWFVEDGHLHAESVWPSGKTLAVSTANLALGDMPGSAGTGETRWQGLILGGWFWNRRLADSEVRRLAGDPFGMFRRNDRLELLAAATEPGSAAARARIWGGTQAYAGPARMRPTGTAAVYGWA